MAAKKKSTKKKGTKKKTTKKKGTRKRPAKKKSTLGKRVRITTKAVVPRKLKVKRKQPSTVRWVNQDTIRHTVRFTVWPFEGPNVRIVLDPGDTSDPFKVDKTLPPLTQYSYRVTPPPSSGPPGGPTVDFED
jgi:plastocyanin